MAEVQQQIVMRCPTCGHQTVFIGAGGHLTCSWIPCKNPGIENAIERLQVIQQCLAQFVERGEEHQSLARTAAIALMHPRWFFLMKIADDLRKLEKWAGELLANPMKE